MNPIDVIINSKIPLKVVKSADSESILYCSDINEHLFNVCIFKTKEKDLILEYKELNDEKYVTLSVTDGGNLYENIRFRIVQTTGDTPFCVFNPSYIKPKLAPITPGHQHPPIEKKIIEEKNNPVLEDIKIQEPEKPYVPLKSGEYYEVAVNSKVPMVMLESDQAENILFCNSFQDHLFNVGVFKARNAELILEYSTTSNKKYAYLDLLFENGDLYKSVKFKVVMTQSGELPFSTFNLKTLDQTTKEYVEFTGPIEEQIPVEPVLPVITETTVNNDELECLKEEYNVAIEKARELERKVLQEKLILEKQQLEISKKSTIVEAAKEIENNVWNTILEKLEKFKETLQTQFKQSSKKDLDEYIIGKLKEDIEKSIELDEKINEIIDQHKNIKTIKEEFRSYVDKSVQSALKEAKRFAGIISEGGGGSVAVQYGQGGVMEGNLTVNSLTVRETFNICGDILPCVTDTYSLGSSALRFKDLHLSGNTLYIGDAKIQALGTSILFPEDQITQGNATVVGGDIDVSTGNYLSAGINLLDIFGGNAINILAPNSGRWDSTYTTVNTNSSNWATYQYVSNNFLNLTGGTIDGDLRVNDSLTVYGNLTALGDSYFVNTTFTTTSALSVINVGVGPALYVYQGPGLYNIASFYDGDGVEVLHVGNADFWKRGYVGINTSYPNVELTVNGNISSNAIIYTVGGTSDNWNSVYTITNLYSGNWNSVYSSVSPVSSEWNSVYNSWNQLSGGYVTYHYLSTNNVLLSAATVTDNINVGGTGYFSHVAAATKSFYIKHPNLSGKHLQYGSLESPYHGIRLTGQNEVAEEVFVGLPHYIRDLVHEKDVNIQITNFGHTKNIYVSAIDINRNGFTIKRKCGIFDKKLKYKFFWTFTAIRKDIPLLMTEI